jgi:hypothetical protein
MGAASVKEVADWVETKSQVLDPERKGVKFVIRDLRKSEKEEVKLTFSLTNASVMDVANRMCLDNELVLTPLAGALQIEIHSRESAPPPEGDNRKIEGSYGTPADYTGGTLVLENGRFRFVTWNDGVGIVSGEAGKYRREGRRIILIGDNPDFIQAFVWAEYDGLPMLFMDTNFYRTFIQTGDLEPGWVLHRAWGQLGKHPKLQRIFREREAREKEAAEAAKPKGNSCPLPAP